MFEVYFSKPGALYPETIQKADSKTAALQEIFQNF